MSDTDWQEVIGTIGIFILVTSVIVVSIWQVAATARARAVLAREKEYRQLADRAVVVQEATERQLGEMQARLTSVERLLKDVE